MSVISNRSKYPGMEYELAGTDLFSTAEIQLKAMDSTGYIRISPCGRNDNLLTP